VPESRDIIIWHSGELSSSSLPGHWQACVTVPPGRHL
jgi:hypothetical protein